MPEFTSPLAAFVGIVAIFAGIAVLGFSVSFGLGVAQMVWYDRKTRKFPNVATPGPERRGIGQNWVAVFRGERVVSRWKPPEEYTQADIEEYREHIHPRWTPPTVPGQCPICGAMPGERCDAGLHC